jgi:hypothetical protein
MGRTDEDVCLDAEDSHRNREHFKLAPFSTAVGWTSTHGNPGWTISESRYDGFILSVAFV